MTTDSTVSYPAMWLGNRRFLNTVILSLQWAVAVTQCTVVRNIDEKKSVNLPECIYVTSSENGFQRTTHCSTHCDMDHSVDNTGIASNTSQSANVCLRLSPQLLHCDLSQISRNAYRIENQALFNDTDLIAELGDYYVDDSGQAYTCDQPIRATRTSPRCHNISLNSDEYSILLNGSFYIKHAQALISRPQYHVDVHSGQANVCYPLSIAFLNCDSKRKKLVPPYSYSLQRNMKLYYMDDNLLFDLGDYYFVNDVGDVELCIHYTVVLGILRKLLVVSDICLSLSFLYQWLEPRRSCYKKCFMCHHFSLALACSWNSYVKAVPLPTSDVSSYVRFSIRYFAFVAAASWLATAGYDIWRSFIALNQCQQRSQGTRRFLYYSIVGWGTPLVLLTLLMAVNFSSTLQKALSINPNLGPWAWFHDHLTSYVFFYGPMQVLYSLNGIFFFCTVYQIRKIAAHCQMLNNQRNRRVLRVSLKLSFVMGVFWTIECVLWISRQFTTFPIRYISDSVLALQGMALFWLTTFKKETPKILRDNLQMVTSKVKAIFDRIKYKS